MKRPNKESDRFNLRTKLILFHGTGVSASEAVSLPDETLTYNFLLERGVSSSNLKACGISLVYWKGCGFESAKCFEKIGFDSLDLVEGGICNEMLLMFGRDDIVDCFLRSENDAVAIAGSQGAVLLNVSIKQLLEQCIGYPAHALSVLKQSNKCTSENRMHNLTAKLLLDCGLQLKTLASIGIMVGDVIEETKASPRELELLGFSFST